MGDSMNGKDEFKAFVKNNPNLIKHVRNGSKTWQDFYEIFSLYGSDKKVWSDYLNISSSGQTLDFMSWIKGIDVDSIQNGVASIQRVLDVVQDFTSKDKDTSSDDYKPRPLYRHFED